MFELHILFGDVNFLTMITSSREIFKYLHVLGSGVRFYFLFLGSGVRYLP